VFTDGELRQGTYLRQTSRAKKRLPIPCAPLHCFSHGPLSQSYGGAEWLCPTTIIGLEL